MERPTLLDGQKYIGALSVNSIVQRVCMILTDICQNAGEKKKKKKLNGCVNHQTLTEVSNVHYYSHRLMSYSELYYKKTETRWTMKHVLSF